MNLYELFIIFFGVGLFMSVYPLIMSNFMETFAIINILYFGIGSGLIGAGIGCGVGYITYRKEGEKNDE